MRRSVSAFPPRHTHLVSVIPCMALIAGVGATAITKSIAELIFPSRTHARSIVQTILATSITLAVIWFGFQRYYSHMQVDYPPAFEDIASWLAWRADKPVDIIYLGEIDTPHRVEYLVNTAMIHHGYKTMLISEFSPATDLKKNKPTLIFVDSPHAENFPWREDEFNGFGKPVSYKYRHEYTIGYALTNTDIDLNPKVGIDDGLNSLIYAPVRYVLLTLLILLVISLIFLTRNKISWPNKEILLDIGKNQTTDKQSTEIGGNEKPEFDFHLRIRIPPRKRTKR